MFRGFAAIIYKETIHIVRDPRTFFLMLLVPGFQLTVFGYAMDLDVKHIPTAVCNLDGREASRNLIDSFVNSGYFDIVETPLSDKGLIESIVSGRSKIALKIPPDYTDQLLLGRDTHVQALIDGSDSTVAMQGLNVANSIALRKSLGILGKSLDTSGPPIELRSRVLFNPDMKTANFMIPGLVGLIMQLVTMLLTAFAVVREKETGTLEQLMVTPVSRLGLMLGKLVPYGVIGFFETGLVLCMMRYLFSVPIAGNLILLSVFSVIFLFTALGLGLLVSTMAANQVQAVQVAFAIILPSVLLSGFLFPQENMPRIIYWLSQAIPLTYFMRILRGIIIRGAGFQELWPQAACLTVLGLAVLTISALRFRKTVS